MPRPSSATVTEPSTLIVTLTSCGVAGHGFVDRVVDDFVDQVVQAAHAVSPMYMPGRSRTCSRSLRCFSSSAVYALPSPAGLSDFVLRFRQPLWCVRPCLFAIGGTEITERSQTDQVLCNI